MYCKYCKKQFKKTHSRQVHCSKECRLAYKKTLMWNDEERNRDYLRNYGITLEDYNRMFEEQQGCCKICGVHQLQLDKNLSVDHDHKTGKVRGLLCFKHNFAIGLLDDNPDLIKKVLEYLE